MVKRVEGFKKVVSILAKFFMVNTMIFTMILYGFNIYRINYGQFFVARTR